MDVKYSITVDAAGAVTSIKNVDSAIDGLGKTSKQADGVFSGLWKQMALGNIAAGLVTKAGHFLIESLKGTVQAAIDSEKAQKSLDAALLTTGRPVEELSRHFSDYADQLMKSTIYDDEAIKGTQALLLQLSNLDRDGIDKATKGAIGLASVMGIDLESAARVVAKSMSGNTALLSRYGVHVRETGTAEEKRADALNKLSVFYQRAEKDTETYGGKLAKLKVNYREIQEAVGKLVTSNTFLMDGLNKVAEGIIYLANANDMLAAQDKVIRDQENRRIEWLSKTAVAAGWAYGEMGRLILQQGNSAAATMRLINTDEKYAKEKAILQKVVQEEHAAYDKAAADRLKAEKGTVAAAEADKAAAEEKKKLVDAVKDFLALGSPMETALKKYTDAQLLMTKAVKSGDMTTDQMTKALKYLWNEYLRTVAPVKSADDALLKLAKDATGTVVPALVTTANTGAAAATKLKVSWGDSAKNWVIYNKTALDQIAEMTHTVINGIDNIIKTSTNNRIANMDKEYQAKLLEIKNSTMAEEDKNKAIEGLDAEYDIKRKGLLREAAQQGKLVAIANAIINTAEGMTKALAQGGGIFGPILAAVVGAFGAIQIAMIRAQPIPLASGAIFKKKADLMSASGQEYQVAEAGEAEIVSSPRKLREAIMGRGGQGGPAGGSITLVVPIYIAGKKIEDQVIKIVEEAGQLGRLRLAGKVVT